MSINRKILTALSRGFIPAVIQRIDIDRVDVAPAGSTGVIHSLPLVGDRDKVKPGDSVMVINVGNQRVAMVRDVAVNSVAASSSESSSVSPISITRDEHGELIGLADDDHPQYMTLYRHDTQGRHTLGSIVPHDDHGVLSGLSDDDHAQYLNVPRHGNTSLHAIGTVVPHDDHGALGGLGDDDHSQYLTAERCYALKIDDFATPDDNTDLNVTTGHHGLAPKAPGGTASFLRADASWAVPAAPTSMALRSYEGTLVSGVGTLRIYNKLGRSVVISQVFLAVATVPTTQAIVVDVNKNGSTIFTNQAHRPQVAAAANTGYTTAIDVATWADGEYLTVDIDQVGSGTAGADLTVHIIYN